MLKRTAIGWAALAALSGVAMPSVQAQETQRVEITGSSIRRVDAETALPVTVIRTEDLVRQGVTTAEQAMSRIAANQSNFGASQSVGGTTGGKAEADLRGLSGPLGTNANKTLVLLNGRRLANHPFDAAAVDLNAIPLAAVDRIEILRDGASSIYGTDAIGGVINFILKREFRGAEISASIQQPESGKSGRVERASVVGGFGSVRDNGFSLLGTLDWRRQKALMATERPFGSTGILGSTRGAITAGTSGSAFPGDVGGFEPSGPNCDPPFSVPRFTTPDNTGAFNSCRYDFTRSIDLIPENEQLTGLLRGTLGIGENFTLAAEYLNARNRSTSRVAPAPTSHLIPASSPFFPAGAPITQIPDINSTDPNATVPGGVVNWRQVPAGKRTSGDDTTNERGMLELQGSLGNFDLRAAAGSARSKSTASVKRGYVNDGLIQQGVFDGVINPFGTHSDPTFGQTPAGLAAIEAAQVVAPTVIGKSTVDFVDVRVGTEFAGFGAGPLSVAFGAEYRREKAAFEATDITAQLGSLGVDPDSDTSGSRKVTGVFAEIGIPIVKSFDITLAARFDRYSDFGSTFNPKASFKFQPLPQLALRGSVNKGFRAPTLYEVYQPQALSFTSDNYDDPALCPGGEAVAGASAGVVCGQQVLIRSVGPVGNGQSASTLTPEKSQQFSLGLVFEPARQVSMTVDYWQLKIKNLINGLPEQEIFGSAARYPSRFVRCSQLPTGDGPGIRRGDIDTCLNFPNFDPIAYIDSPTENLGELQVNGIDVSASWRSQPDAWGRFTITGDGTYITKYQYQRERGGTFINAAGRYSDNAPVFRWQHVLAVGWEFGSFATTLSNRFKSGYTDQDGTSDVGSYSVFDLGVSYTGIRNLTLSAGINNLLDTDPPRTTQVTTFQRGYDPRFTDPLGRTYMLRATYKF